MTKNKKIIALLVGALVIIVGVALTLVITSAPENADNVSQSGGMIPSESSDGSDGSKDTKETKNPNVDDPANDYQAPTKDEDRKSIEEIPEEDIKNAPDNKEYLGGKDAKPGLCTSIQKIYLKDVQPAMESSGYGELEKATKKAAKQGHKLIKESKGEDKETKKILGDLMTSVEDYGKYTSDPNATQNQLKSVFETQFYNEEAAKQACNW